MKKTLFIIILIFLMIGIIYAVDQKLTALTELTAVADVDIIYIVDDPGGTPLQRKITVLNLFDTIDTFSELNTIVTDKTLVNEEDAATWDALGTFGLGITITTGDPFTLGTNRIDNGSDLLDGEMIAADTIDDDSIDWADVTGVDITLTDCGAITSTGTITATVGFDIVGAADMDYGSADVTDHTFLSDGTGTGEFVLKAGAIDGTEILDDTVDSDDYAADSIDNEHINWADIDNLGDEGAVTLAATLTITDNESTAENNALIFTSGGDLDGGDLGLECDGTVHYNPSTGTITTTEFVGGGASVTSVDAITGDSATAFFDAGTIEHEYGGLEADVSGYGGLVGITGGSTLDVNTSAEMLAAIDDETGTGLLVFATSPTLVTPILGTITSGVGTALTALDGENIQNDTIDNDSIDWADMTDLTTDGAISTDAVQGTDISLASEAAGDIMYFNGSDWVRLAKGTAGQVLELSADPNVPEWDTDDSGGSTAWDDIGNPDAADEIDFAAHITELNVEDFRIGDGGANYVKFSGTPVVTFVGNADIDLPNNSVDLADLATAAYAKDLVTTAPITGAADNIFVGADSDVTVALTLLKDIVTTAPITGGEDDVLPGADADLTIAITLAKDLVTTAPVTGGTDNILPGADADITVALDFTATWDFSGATVTLPSLTKNNDRYFAFNAWNPNALYDTDTQICIEPNLPANITITEVTITLDADPATELDWDLKWADAFIGLGNAALIVAIDTTSGTTDIASGFDDATVVAGKCLYIEFAADPDSNIKQAMVKIKYDYD